MQDSLKAHSYDTESCPKWSKCLFCLIICLVNKFIHAAVTLLVKGLVNPGF